MAPVVRDGVSSFTYPPSPYLRSRGGSGITNSPYRAPGSVGGGRVRGRPRFFIDATAMSTEIAERGSIALYGIQFEFDNASLQANSADTITEVAKALQADPELGLYIVGHTDSEGAHKYNQALSESRAKSVVAALVNGHGIAADRVAAIGVGQVAPVASNDTEEGRELNRRVAIVKR